MVRLAVAKSVASFCAAVVMVLVQSAAVALVMPYMAPA